MKKFSFNNLSLNKFTQKDVKIVEKRKWFFLASGIVVVLAMIFMGIYWGVLGSPLNLGMDFTGGYTIQITAGTKINDQNYDQYADDITDLVNNYVYKDEAGAEYKINLNTVVRIGSGTATSLRIEFRAPSNVKDSDLDTLMEKELIPDLVDRLNEFVAYEIPVVTLSGSVATVVYSASVKSFYKTDLEDYLANANISVSSKSLDSDNKTITLNLSGTYTVQQLTEALQIRDIYSAQAKYTDMVGGTVSTELIVSAITAVLVALLLMLLYIIFRFEFVSGLAAILALMHDMIMMFMLMIIFRIEFNATFIAALITILGYSINNSIIIFDRLRENINTLMSHNKNVSADYIANRSVLDSMSRTINTTLTTFIMIFMVVFVCAIGGITDMVTFGLPIIFGLLSGFFSATCLAPSIWSLIRRNSLSPHVSKFELFKKIGKKEDGKTAPKAEAQPKINNSPVVE